MLLCSLYFHLFLFSQQVLKILSIFLQGTMYSGQITACTSYQLLSIPRWGEMFPSSRSSSKIWNKVTEALKLNLIWGEMGSTLSPFMSHLHKLPLKQWVWVKWHEKAGFIKVKQQGWGEGIDESSLYLFRRSTSTLKQSVFNMANCLSLKC